MRAAAVHQAAIPSSSQAASLGYAQLRWPRLMSVGGSTARSQPSMAPVDDTVEYITVGKKKMKTPGQTDARRRRRRARRADRGRAAAVEAASMAATMTVLADPIYLDRRLPPHMMMRLRRVCKATRRPLTAYLNEFLRSKHVRAGGVYMSEADMWRLHGRSYSDYELMMLAQVVYTQMRLLRTASKVGAVCAGSYALQHLIESEAAAGRMPQCDWMYGDVDLFCFDERQRRAILAKVDKLYGAYAGPKRSGGWYGELGARGPARHVTCDTHSVIRAREWQPPLADRGAFVESAKTFDWCNVGVPVAIGKSATNPLGIPRSAIPGLIDECLPSEIEDKAYRVQSSVYVDVTLALPSECLVSSYPDQGDWTLGDWTLGGTRQGLDTGWDTTRFRVNVILVEDTRPAAEQDRRPQLSAMDILLSFDMMQCAVAMGVPSSALEPEFEYPPDTLELVRTGKMRLTQHFLCGLVPRSAMPSRLPRRLPAGHWPDDPDEGNFYNGRPTGLHRHVVAKCARIDKYLYRGFSLA